MSDNNSNNDNIAGKKFEQLTAEILSKYFGIKFQTTYGIPIGNPPKMHKFDLVSLNSHYVGECKNISWTKSGKIPGAKISAINEAIFYLSLLPSSKFKFIALKRDICQNRKESLAEYYYRSNKHLLKDIIMIEIDVKKKTVSKIFGKRKSSRSMEDVISDLTDKLVRYYSPQKIILFGSYAHGNPRADSDIDMLIIKETNERFIDRWVTVQRILADSKRKIPLETIVITPDELKKRLSIDDQFLMEIIENGRILYAA